MVSQAMPSGFPVLPRQRASPAPLAARVPRLGQPSQAPRVQTAQGMKERLCYLFPSKNQLLLNSCFSGQVSPPPSASSEALD